MRNMLRSRLALVAVALSGLVLLNVVRAEEEPKKQTPEKSTVAIKIKMDYAVKPKPLSDTVEKGLKYLVDNQKENGGWAQGGGWRTNLKGSGRVQGEDVEDPADVGNTCIALLALIRAGNTPTEGPYAKNVARGLDFVMSKVEQSDDKSLFVTDVKGTQIQSKIGPYVDTFLTSMVLAELKGKSGDKKAEQRLLAAAKKTIAKMEKNQKEDGTFAGNNGWASVLSQGLANKGFNYAAQNGIAVQAEALDRVQEQVARNFDDKTGKFRMATGGGYGGFSGRAPIGSASGPATADLPSDAGVPLYAQSSNLTNAADVVRSLRLEEEKLKKVLEDAKAPKEAKEKAQARLKDVQKAEELNEKATEAITKQLDQPGFVQGFGSNGGEEFLSFMNISETLLLKGGKDWKKWDKAMTESLTRVQNKDGSWSGHHCITGKTFCTATALLVLMADRTPFPADAISKAREDAKENEKEDSPAKEDKE